MITCQKTQGERTSTATACRFLSLDNGIVDHLKLSSWATEAAFMRWQNRVVGGIYCALGVRLALQEK